MHSPAQIADALELPCDEASARLCETLAFVSNQGIANCSMYRTRGAVKYR